MASMNIYHAPAITGKKPPEGSGEVINIWEAFPECFLLSRKGSSSPRDAAPGNS